MLNKIAKSIMNNKNILEKRAIDPIVKYIDENSYKSERIFTDIGEDAASIKDGEKYILITTDRIKTEFVENYPFGAGFSSILVSVDDIYACGGIPLAASVILSFFDNQKGQKIIEGICEGSRKFRVPIIRGHTNIQGKQVELSTTMIGEIKKEHYISAGNAKVNDKVMLIMDLEGRIGKANRLFFDTTTFKESDEVLDKRKSMNVVAELNLAHSSKDVSNGGIFGTILQLIHYSRMGADININKIEIPPTLLQQGYDLEIFIQMYLTTSFILTASERNCPDLIKIFDKYHLHAKMIGDIIEEPNLLRINDGKNTMDVFKG